MDAILRPDPVADVPGPQASGRCTHSRLHQALSEILRVAVFEARKFGTVPDDPTGEMPAGVPIAGGPDIAAFAPAPLRLLAAGVTNHISARVADTPSTSCGYPAVSVKYLKPEAGQSSAQNP